MPTTAIADGPGSHDAYDSDHRRDELAQSGWDLTAPRRRGSKRIATRDGHKLRRCRRRWKIERTIGWIANYRRLIVRHERPSFLYRGFIPRACAMICLNRF